MTKQDDYQALSERLDVIVNALQQPDVRVDDAVKLYEEGLQVINKLEAHFTLAENAIKALKLTVKSTKG